MIIIVVVPRKIYRIGTAASEAEARKYVSKLIIIILERSEQVHDMRPKPKRCNELA